MCEDFAPEFGNTGTGCSMTTTHRLTLPFSSGNFCQKNNVTVVPHPPYSTLFPRLKIKLKGRHFDTIEAVEAESQSVLNTVTEHYFRVEFKKW
jgi:hypothetical protein